MTADDPLARADARFHDLVRVLNAIVWEADADVYRMTFVSPRAIDLTGYPAERWLNDPGFWEERLHPDDHDAAIAATDAAIAGKTDVSLEYRFRIADGSYRWFSDVIRVVPTPDGQGSRVVGVMIDVTDRKALEARLTHRASHDPLTGLLNRDRLRAELAGRAGGGQHAVLFVDLDDFKDINDALGHAAGDEVLRVVAARLLSGARTGDLVGRFGGDEFVVIAEVADPEEARAVAERLLGRLRAPVALASGVVRVDASVGIAFTGDDESVDTLLGDADAAMYEAKRSGVSVRSFEPGMRRQALRRLARRSAEVPGALLGAAARSRSGRRDAGIGERSTR